MRTGRTVRPPASPAEIHALAGYAIAAGVLMVALGILRLRLPTPRESPYPRRSITLTYSLMIALGLLLIGLAVRWGFL